MGLVPGAQPRVSAAVLLSSRAVAGAVCRARATMPGPAGFLTLRSRQLGGMRLMTQLINIDNGGTLTDPEAVMTRVRALA
jgi:hypothetical protein